MKKLTKQDLKNNAYNLFLTFFYTIILVFVYAFWAFKAFNILWISILISVIIVLAGFIVAYLWTLSVKKKNEEVKSDYVS